MKKFNFGIISFIIFILLTVSCGYKPIYSSKKIEFRIIDVIYENSNENRAIAKSLKQLSNKDGERNLLIKINSFKSKRTVLKDSKGNPETFEMKIIVKMLLEENDSNYTKSFEGKFAYNNNENKYKLSQYEKEVEKLITEDLVKNILKYLSSI